MRIIVFGVLCTLFSGCASLNKDQCLYADWQLIGFEDGTRGLQEQRIADHRKACAEYGVIPDLKEYRIGHRAGLISFCTPRNGFQLGEKGARYNGNCPLKLEESFLDGFRAGRELHEVTTEIATLEREISLAEQRLDRLNENIGSKEKALIKEGNTEEFRKRTYKQIKKLGSEYVEVKQKLEHLYSSVYAAEDSLAFLRNSYNRYID